MTDAPLTPRESDDALAAEYVLGVQDLTERSATQQRVRREPGFAALVEGWEYHFAGLNDEFAEVKAPNLLPMIEARLFPKPAQAARPRFNLFRWLSGMAVAASLVLVGIATLVPPQPELVATLATADQRLSYEVSHLGEALQITRVAGLAAPEGQVHELWVIAPGQPPVSLGLLADKPLVVNYPVPPEGWVLAVSVEPAGGAPGGLPTGPVILTAKIGA